MAENPFTLVYNALFALPTEHPVFRSMVKVGNRVSYTTSREPIKQTVITADLPEVVLTSDGMSVALYNTSSTSKVVRQYTWIMSTGDFRLQALLYPVEWAVFCAMLAWKEKLTALKWNDQPFVKRADIVGVTNGESNPERNRQIAGWTALWRCEVEMHFRTSDLKTELTIEEP